ncbi:hypothetical protein [Nocardioides piscis]|uniref:Ferredoxin n=1 Tax=Nocardioides piscis TaxID=2714938 RepID=A0A6G7YIT7_9ACTN|nr:hypothetical protein [Nocardioides piscis]QIK76652.1 hypothetical protein G7071_15690 [Nocardioides piscis]
MAYILPTSPDTLEDQRLYTRARLTEVACLDCLARVGVKKNSEHHTSIQWSSGSLAECAEFRRQDQQPGGRSVHQSCPRMQASIDAAVRDGELTIGAQDGY